MRQLILFTSFFYFSICAAQTIDLRRDTAPSPFQDADVGAMAFGDIDKDGDMDLMVTGKGGPIRSTLYENDGMGNFTEVMNTPFVHVFEGTVAFEDIDGDSDLDLFITGSTSSPTRTANLYKNDGSGNYTLVAGTTLEKSQAGDFEFGDVDNDGDKDLILTGIDVQDMGFTKLYKNDGAGNFTKVQGTPFEAIILSSAAFIDIDNDNDLDLITTGENNQGNPITSLYTNDSTGTFTAVANTPFEDVSSGDIAIGDSDKDGDMDILISGMTSVGGTISELYLNDGSGTFSLSSASFPGTSIGATNFADFDLDGDLDVLLIGNGNAIIANIYENLGSNMFVLADSLAGAYLSSAAIGDMNGDMAPDLVIGGTSFTAPVRSTKVYMNETPIQTAIDEAENLTSIKLYPNPSDGLFHVKLSEQAPTSVQIFNTRGQRVYAHDQVTASIHTIELMQPAGMYFIIMTQNNKTTTRRLILK